MADFSRSSSMSLRISEEDDDVFFDSSSSRSRQIELKPSPSRPKLEAPGGHGLKQFISRRIAVSRGRWPGSKLLTQKGEMMRSKSPNGMWVWKSQDSADDIFDDEDATLGLVDPDHLEIRAIHQSVSMRPYCFQVQTARETKTIACSNEEEYNCWMQGLRELLWPDRSNTVHLDTSLSVWVVEAKGVPRRKRYFCELMLDKVLYARTSVKNKEDMLFWGEQFTFSDLPPIETLTVSLFRESDTKRKRKLDKNLFVGSSVLNLFSLEANTEVEKWIQLYEPGLSPKINQKVVPNPKKDRPCVRMKIKYDTFVVLPVTKYKDLHDYIRENYLHLTKTLESCVSLKTKDKLAQILIRIMHATGETQRFLVDLIMNEVKNTENENLTFRGNTLATKSIDAYMKMVGKMYLQETLGSFIRAVYELEDDLEVDPQKMTSHQGLEENQKMLIKMVEDAWWCIQNSVENFPPELRIVFYLVRRNCETLHKDIASRLISASVFLRFLCPAILSPSLFQLTQEYPNQKAARALTLIAKTIQNLANFSRFGGKEDYMEILNSFVEINMSHMEKFLRDVSCHPKICEKSSFSGIVDLGRELSILYHLLAVEVANLRKEKLDQLDPLSDIISSLRDAYNMSPPVDRLRLTRHFESVADVCSKPLRRPGRPRSPNQVRSHSPMELVSPATSRDPCVASRDPCVASRDPCVASRDPCVASRDPCVASRDPCVASRDPCVASRDSCVASRDPCVASRDPCVASRDLCVASRDPSVASCDPSVESSPPMSGTRRAYDDSPLSFVGDYVSGCSLVLVCHTPCVSSRKKVQGRGMVSLPKGVHPRVQRASSFDVLSPSSTLERERMCRSVSESVLSHDGRGSQASIHRLDSDDSRSYAGIKRVLRRSDSDASSVGSQGMWVPRRASTCTKETGYSRRGEHILRTNGASNERLLWSKSDARVADGQGNYLSEPLFCERNNRLETHESGDLDSAMLNSWAHFSRVREPSESKVNLRVSQVQGRRFLDLSPYQMHTGMTPAKLQHGGVKILLNSHGADLAPIHSNGFVEALHEGRVRSRSGSFHSSCSTCSFSSHSYSSQSYSSVEELNPYGIFVEEDSMFDMPNMNNIGDFRRSDAVLGGHLPVPMSGGGMLHQHTPVEEDGLRRDGEVNLLRHQLADAQALLHRYQQQMTERSAHFERTVLQLQEKLTEADMKMKFQRSETEQQMKSVINRLVAMESELRRDHAEMEGIIRAKQDVIEMQERRMQALHASNERLMKALLRCGGSAKETFVCHRDDLDNLDADNKTNEHSLVDLRTGGCGPRRVHNV